MFNKEIKIKEWIWGYFLKIKKNKKNILRYKFKDFEKR